MRDQGRTVAWLAGETCTAFGGVRLVIATDDLDNARAALE